MNVKLTISFNFEFDPFNLLNPFVYYSEQYNDLENLDEDLLKEGLAEYINKSMNENNINNLPLIELDSDHISIDYYSSELVAIGEIVIHTDLQTATNFVELFNKIDSSSSSTIDKD